SSMPSGEKAPPGAIRARQRVDEKSDVVSVAVLLDATAVGVMNRETAQQRRARDQLCIAGEAHPQVKIRRESTLLAQGPRSVPQSPAPKTALLLHQPERAAIIESQRESFSRERPRRCDFLHRAVLNYRRSADDPLHIGKCLENRRDGAKR